MFENQLDTARLVRGAEQVGAEKLTSEMWRMRGWQREDWSGAETAAHRQRGEGDTWEGGAEPRCRIQSEHLAR